MAAVVPEDGEGAGQAQERVVVTRRPATTRAPPAGCHARGRSHPARPGGGSKMSGPTRSARSRKNPAWRSASGCLLAARFQTLQTELAHRLQHPEAWLRVRPLVLPQQALVDQRGHAPRRHRAFRRGRDRLRRLQRAAAREDARRRKRVCSSAAADRDSRRSHGASSAAEPAGRGPLPSAGASCGRAGPRGDR